MAMGYDLSYDCGFCFLVAQISIKSFETRQFSHFPNNASACLITFKPGLLGKNAPYLIIKLPDSWVQKLVLQAHIQELGSIETISVVGAAAKNSTGGLRLSLRIELWWVGL